MVSKSDYTLIQSVVDVLGFLILSIALLVQSIVRSFLPKSYQNYKKLKGQTVLITGGGGGLGRLLAIRLSKLKAKVVLWDVNLEGVLETVKIVQSAGGSAYGYKCDLANKDDVYALAEVVKREVGDINVLINNAGVSSGKLLLETPDELIQKTFEVNILAHFWTVKAFLPSMISSNNGHIVTIASMAGFAGVSKLVDYSASKYAAVGFDEALGVELESLGIKGVKTTVVCPYFIRSTGMFDNVQSRFLPRLELEEVADKVIEGLRKEEKLVMIPSYLRWIISLKNVMPWAVVSMALRGLVPDASPIAVPPTKTKLISKVNNNTLNNPEHSISSEKCLT